jgi:hypothetical protein
VQMLAQQLLNAGFSGDRETHPASRGHSRRPHDHRKGSPQRRLLQ